MKFFNILIYFAKIYTNYSLIFLNNFYLHFIYIFSYIFSLLVEKLPLKFVRWSYISKESLISSCSG